MHLSILRLFSTPPRPAIFSWFGPVCGRLLLLFLFALGGITTGRATLLIYESFSGYASGDLVGQAVSATGLIGNYTRSWAGPTPITFASTGLTFGSGASTFPVAGGAANLLAEGYSPGYTAKLNTGPVAGTIFGSYLVNWGGSAFAGAGVYSRFNNGSAVLSASARLDNLISIQYSTETAGSASAVSADTNTTYLAISKWTNIGGAGTGTGNLWILSAADYANVIAAGLTEANLDLYHRQKISTSGNTFTSLGNTDFLQFNIAAGAAGNTRTIDEIRYGTTLADVAAAVEQPSPWPNALFLDTFQNGIPADSDTEAGIWTLASDLNSSQTETGGKFVQTAVSTGAEPDVIASSSTPVQARFNFFDQQIKIGAEISEIGSRGRLVLSSQSGSVNNAADSLAVLFRYSGQAAGLSRKIDAPYTRPDNIASSQVTALVKDSNGDTAVATGVISGFNIILNAKRFLYTVSSASKGSGILRFSGAHGIDRAKWGTNGDSALALESERLAQGAGTSTSTTWDNVVLEPDTTQVLAEPFWNFRTKYTSTTGGLSITDDFRIWLPSTESLIRGIIFIGPGTGEDLRYMVHDKAAQEAARAMGFGLIGYKNGANMNLWSGNATLIKGAIQAVLNDAATVSGHPEISNAPLCITGISAGGFDSCYLAMYWPERTITFVPHRGGGWNSPTFLSEATKKVPGLFVAGSLDGNGATGPMVLKQIFSAWRSLGGQAAFAVDWGVGHTPRGNQSWEATFAWMTEVANLRYPRPMVPSLTPGAGAPTLIDLPDDSGWLGENASFSALITPSVTQTFAKVAPYASYTAGAISAASWLPNETCAKLYRALTSTDRVARSEVPLQGPLQIETPRQYDDPVKAGQTITITLDPREADDVSALASVDFYAGSTLISQDVAAPWSVEFTPTQSGLQAITAVSTDAAGNQRDAMRVVAVIPADFPPVASPTTLAPLDETVTATLSGSDPEGNGITYAIAQQPEHGTVSLNATTGGCTYQTSPGFVGTDSFTFTVTDGTLTSAPANVEIYPSVSPVGNIATLAATPGSNNATINLTWSAANNAASYSIERSTQSTTGFVQVATVSAPAVSHTDTGLTLNQTYYYRVQAKNSATQSAYSSVVSSLPANLNPPIGTIASLTASAGGQAGEIALSWSSATNATTYRVEQATSAVGPFYLLAEDSLLTYTDTYLPANSTYYYRVQAYNSGYTSAYTPVVSAQPYVPPTIAGWFYINFGDTTVYEGRSGDLDAPNRDGITNLMKYALGINLFDANWNYLVVEPERMPVVQTQMIDGTNYLICSFIHNKNAMDLSVRVEVTSDLGGTWTQIDPFQAANQISITDNSPTDGLETIIVKDTQPITSSNKRFMRLKVTHP